MIVNIIPTEQLQAHLVFTDGGGECYFNRLLKKWSCFLRLCRISFAVIVYTYNDLQLTLKVDHALPGVPQGFLLGPFLFSRYTSMYDTETWEKPGQQCKHCSSSPLLSIHPLQCQGNPPSLLPRESRCSSRCSSLFPHHTCTLHLLPTAAQIQFKTMVLA